MTKPNTLPQQSLLNDIFRYHPLTGVLLWRHRPAASFSSQRDADAWNSRYSNTPAGSEYRGYLRVSIGGQRYLAHRIIYKMVTGKEPEVIDHIDGDPLNNSILNLRSVSVAENTRNAAVSVTNKTGVRGVQWAAGRNKWRAAITVNRKFVHLGMFDNFDDAVSARKTAETVRGFHPNHGRAVKSSA